jgi:hypothetical protein
VIDMWFQRFSSQPPRKLLDEMRRLLMGGLSPWRDVASDAWLRAGRAIADRKNVEIASGLKSRGNDELAYLVGLEAVQMAENVWALHSGGPDHKFGRNEPAIGKLYTVCTNLSHF